MMLGELVSLHKKLADALLSRDVAQQENATLRQLYNELARETELLRELARAIRKIGTAYPSSVHIDIVDALAKLDGLKVKR